MDPIYFLTNEGRVETSNLYYEITGKLTRDTNKVDKYLAVKVLGDGGVTTAVQTIDEFGYTINYQFVSPGDYVAGLKSGAVIVVPSFSIIKDVKTYLRDVWEKPEELWDKALKFMEENDWPVYDPEEEIPTVFSVPTHVDEQLLHSLEAFLTADSPGGYSPKIAVHTRWDGNNFNKLTSLIVFYHKIAQDHVVELNPGDTLIGYDGQFVVLKKNSELTD